MHVTRILAVALFTLWALVAVVPTEAATPKADPDAERPLTVEDLEGIPWRSIGPANMGGRVAALAFVPGSRKSFYVGYGTGGVFKTENLGVTFQPVFDKQAVLSIGAIAVAHAPTDWPGWEAEEAASPPKPDSTRAERGLGKIVWVGTGEGNNRNSSSWGNGVYRSTDAGATFVHLGLEDAHDIPALAVDPRNPDVAYVAALGHLWGSNPERGVYKTSDGGRTWRHVLEVDERTGASDVLIDPSRPDTVYAALYARQRTPWSFSGYSDTGGIFRSDDAGASWKKLAGGLPPRTGRIGLALSAKEPGAILATVESDWGGSGREPFENRSPSGGLFHSADRGEHWERRTDLNFRPFYFSRVAVDPEDPKRVYLPGWDLAISDDGGRTFRRSGSPEVHVDFHAIAINPLDPSQLIVGNDGGVYVSHDRAATWDYLNHVAAGQFYRVAVDLSDPYRVAGGLQDNGSWLGPSETLYVMEGESKDGILSKDWETIGFGDGFTVGFDPTDPNLVYTTSQGGALVRARLDTMVRKLIRPSPREGQERLRFNWNAPFLVSRHDPSVLYQGGNRLFKLTERGDLWFAISPDLSQGVSQRTDAVGSDAETYGTVVALAESPLAQGLLWAGTDDGRIHVTRDDGKGWNEVTPRDVAGLYVSSLVASTHAEGLAYAAVDGHRSDVFRPFLWVTRDYGRSWREIAGDLPKNEPVKVVQEDPGSPDVLYVGTERGCYVSVDRGAHWVRLNGDSLPPVAVDDLVVHPRERDLVAGTHGRSIWILDDASFLGQLTPEVRGRALTLFPPLPARPRQYMAREYGVAQGLFRAKNPPLGALFHFWVRDRAGQPFTLVVKDAGGAEVRKLDGLTRRGVNRVVWDLTADDKHVFKGPDQEWFTGQKLFVPAGVYEVALTVGEEKARAAVEVLAVGE